jgi:hypothetical protein
MQFRPSVSILSPAHVENQRHILCDMRPAQLAGRGRDKGIEMVYSEEKILCTKVEQPRLNKDLLYRQDKLNEPTKEGSFSFVLFESPFTSVSISQQGSPLSSLSVQNFCK